MKEIHKFTGPLVYLDLYGGTADALPTATLNLVDGSTRSLVVAKVTPPPAGIDDRYQVNLTVADTSEEGRLSVDWAFAMNSVSVTKTDRFDVVTPYLSIAEVKAIYTTATDEQAKELEAAVRHIINAYTGQNFGKETKTLTVEGHGERALRLPERLMSITGLSTLTATLDPNSVIIVSDGWYIKKGWAAELTTLETESTYWGAADVSGTPGEPGYEKPSHGHIIYAPNVGPKPTVWKDDYPFQITGTWGYEDVPRPVVEAAKLLVNDYACAESIYRDRFLKSIRAADWRFEFNSRAYDSTGNVRADQLLAEYVLAPWEVI